MRMDQQEQERSQLPQALLKACANQDKKADEGNGLKRQTLVDSVLNVHSREVKEIVSVKSPYCALNRAT